MSFQRIRLKKPADWIVTVCGIGNLPIAPGTWCSFIVAIPALFLRPYSDEWVMFGYIGAAVVFSILGFWAVPKLQAEYGSDPQAIVIDEAAGMCLVLAFPLTTFAPLPLLGAVLLFRLFDIRKPWPINKINDSTEPWAVMADDLLAGVFTVVAFYVLYILNHANFTLFDVVKSPVYRTFFAQNGLKPHKIGSCG